MNGNDRRKAEEAKKLAEKAAKAEAKVLSQKNKLAEIERQKDQRLKAKDEKQRANNIPVLLTVPSKVIFSETGKSLN